MEQSTDKKKKSMHRVALLAALLILGSILVVGSSLLQPLQDKVIQTASILFGLDRLVDEEPIVNNNSVKENSPKFFNMKKGETVAIEEDTKVTRGKTKTAKVVDVDSMLLGQSSSLQLDLDDDLSLTVQRDSIEESNGGIIWVGHVVGGSEGDSVYLVSHRGVASGIINYGDRKFELVYTKSGVHAVRELNQEYTNQFTKDDSVAVEGDTTGASVSPVSADSTLTVSNIIDVLVVYTPSAQAEAGGTAGIESRILLAVSETNTAYANSQINSRINLAHMAVVNYTEDGNSSNALSQLRSTSDGKLDEVHALREQYAADHVVLITGPLDNCGIAYRMASLSTSFASSAFSVVKLSCATGYYSFGHELGHNQGMHHDPGSGATGAIYPYAYGYTDCTNFRTIMSYACGPAPRIALFSNTTVSIYGIPTGSATSDNARTLNQTGATVASFRNKPSTTVPATPSGLRVSLTASPSQLLVSWSDNASNETGYEVSRSTNGTNWSMVARLADNTTSYTDVGLSASTAYYYRVSAYNSVGYSPASNIVQISTPAPLADTVPPVITINSPANGAVLSSRGSLSISAAATDNYSVKEISITINGTVKKTCTNVGTCGYSITTRKLSGTQQVITVVAKDPSGNTSTSAVTVTK